jgi:hypothetical protein
MKLIKDRALDGEVARGKPQIPTEESRQRRYLREMFEMRGSVRHIAGVECFGAPVRRSTVTRHLGRLFLGLPLASYWFERKDRGASGGVSRTLLEGGVSDPTQTKCSPRILRSRSSVLRAQNAARG